MYRMNILQWSMSNLLDINIDSNCELECMHAKFFSLQIRNDKHIFFLFRENNILIRLWPI